MRLIIADSIVINRGESVREVELENARKKIIHYGTRYTNGLSIKESGYWWSVSAIWTANWHARWPGLLRIQIIYTLDSRLLAVKNIKIMYRRQEKPLL